MDGRSPTCLRTKLWEGSRERGVSSRILGFRVKVCDPSTRHRLIDDSNSSLLHEIEKVHTHHGIYRFSTTFSRFCLAGVTLPSPSSSTSG